MGKGGEACALIGNFFATLQLRSYCIGENLIPPNIIYTCNAKVAGLGEKSWLYDNLEMWSF